MLSSSDDKSKEPLTCKKVVNTMNKVFQGKKCQWDFDRWAEDLFISPGGNCGFQKGHMTNAKLAATSANGDGKGGLRMLRLNFNMTFEPMPAADGSDGGEAGKWLSFKPAFADYMADGAGGTIKVRGIPHKT